MKLTLGRVMEATPVIANIINEKRAMPQRGKFRLARLYAKLLPEFTTGDAQRRDMIKAYGYRVLLPPDHEGGEPVPADHFSVPPDKAEEFRAAWADLQTAEIDVDIAPVSIAEFDLGPAADGAIHAGELLALGDLVTE